MNLNTTPNSLLKTKQHFEILDGLRGLAAVAVVVFHFMEFATPDYKDNFIAHAYLAVDFFFCLSGFVIAYAYDHKLADLGIIPFLKLRFIRLHPLVIIGSVIGVLAFIFDPFSNLQAVYGFGQTFVLFISSCFMVPYPLVQERYFNLFHLNPPTWSLFWEYNANIAYAVLLIKLPNKVLWLLTAIAAVMLGFEAQKVGYLGVGWGGDNFFGGGIRVLYAFLVGILVYRSKWIIRSKLGFVSMGILLLVVFLVPFSKANSIIDPLLVIIYFPFLVALGAGATLQPGLAKICKFSGDISYPLYVIHYPFLWLFLSYIEVNKPTMTTMLWLIPSGTIALVLMAYGILVLVDLPMRKYLKSIMFKSA
jgi:peptidoglycan/LPS O-acetylase OafA/YrhL